MARAHQTSGKRSADSSDKAIWQYCRALDAEPDEAEQWLDLAGFVDSRLDGDECERVAARLAADPEAAGDAAAARLLVAAPHAAVAEALVARAAALVGAPAPDRGRIVAFARLARRRPRVYLVARWGSLAAAIVMASWLGFALGSDTSIALGQTAQSSDESLIGDLIDPAGGVLRSITDGPES